MNWEYDFIFWLQSLGGEGSFIYYFFSFFSFLGEGVLLCGLLCLLYWCTDKNFAKRIAMPLTFSLCFNEFTKNIIRRQRPWIVNEKVLPLTTIGGYSYPSGHTQSAIVTYGSFSHLLKSKKIAYLSIILSILIALSRIYLGAHFPTDVIGGLVFGLLITIIYFYLEKKVSRKSIFTIELILFIPLLCSAFFNSGYFSGVSEHYFKAAGILIGYILGVITEEKYIKFEKADKLSEKACRLFIGIIITTILFLALKYVFMFFSVNRTLTLVLTFVRYAILFYFVIAIYPMSFQKQKQILNAIFK